MRPLDPRLLRNANATKGFLAATVALGAAGAALVVAQATLLATGIADRTARVLPWLAAVLALRAVVVWAQEQAATRAAATVKGQLRQRLLAHVVRLGPAWLTGRRSGELTTLVTRGLDALDSYFARYLPQVVLAALVPAVVLARILPADPVAGLTVLLTLPLIPLFMALVGLATEARNKRQFALLARLSHHFLDVVAGLPTLKAYRRATAQVRTVGAVTDEYRRATMGTLRLAFLSSLVLELLATLSVALVAVGIGLRLVGGGLDLRTALLVLVLAPEAYLPLRALGTHYHAAAEGLAAAEEVFAVLDTPVSATGTAPVGPGRLVLTNVTVAYPDRCGPALDRFSLTVEPGEIVALTGPSGCGKSTVLHAILGLTTASAGSVTLGGVGIGDADPDLWRSQFVWVPQRPYLSAGTVASNVACGLSTVDSAALTAAATAAGLDVPLSTVVGDRGTGLSAGQRQRVALARAYLRLASGHDPVVLLDEPTANLDAATEERIVDALRNLLRGRTAIVVAHHTRLLDLADRIVDLSAVLV